MVNANVGIKLQLDKNCSSMTLILPIFTLDSELIVALLPGILQFPPFFTDIEMNAVKMRKNGGDDGKFKSLVITKQGSYFSTHLVSTFVATSKCRGLFRWLFVMAVKSNAKCTSGSIQILKVMKANEL